MDKARFNVCDCEKPSDKDNDAIRAVCGICKEEVCYDHIMKHVNVCLSKDKTKDKES